MRGPSTAGTGTAARTGVLAALGLLFVAGAHPAPPAQALDGAIQARAGGAPGPGEGVPAEWVVHGWTEVTLDSRAALGDPYALFVVGRKYLIDAADSGSEEARRIGLEYLEWSARKGFAPADRFLGDLYLAGTDVARDPARAVTHLERAADQGNAAAQRRLGDLYFEGTEVARDPSRALLWYGRALANPAPGPPGDRRWEVGLRIARLYVEPGVAEADPTQARGVLERTARAYPVGPVLKVLADAYARGLGGPPMPGRAVATYDAAAAGYLDRGLLLGIEPADARREAADILAAMERVDPEAAATRRLRLRLDDGSGAAPVP